MAQREGTRRPGFARGRLGLLVVTVVLVAAYAATLLLYWRSTQPPEADIRPDPTEEQLEGRVQVGIDINEVHPAESTASAQLKASVPSDLIDDDSALTEKLIIEVLAFDVDVTTSRRAAAYDTATITFDRGTRFLGAPVTLSLPGQYSAYPLDRYEANVIVLASTVTDAGKRADREVVIGVGGEIPGWRVLASSLTPGPGVELDESDPLREALVTLRRSGSTMAITGLILIAFVVLVTCALLVARSVLFKRRRIEATMASWFAALMFAVIPLRTNLPGSPPMGAWIDFIVVLWVEVGLMIALAVFIASWLSYTPLPDYALEKVTAGEAERPNQAGVNPDEQRPADHAQPGQP